MSLSLEQLIIIHNSYYDTYYNLLAEISEKHDLENLTKEQMHELAEHQEIQIMSSLPPLIKDSSENIEGIKHSITMFIIELAAIKNMKSENLISEKMGDFNKTGQILTRQISSNAEILNLEIERNENIIATNKVILAKYITSSELSLAYISYKLNSNEIEPEQSSIIIASIEGNIETINLIKKNQQLSINNHHINQSSAMDLKSNIYDYNDQYNNIGSPILN